MAATLAQIRTGIADNLSVVYGATIQVSAYMKEAPSPPTIQVKGPEDVEYNMALGPGLTDWTMIIQGFAGSSFDIGAQVILDDWIAPAGLKAAVEADRTLGGKVQDCFVERNRHYGLFHLPSGMSFLGVEWVVHVYAFNT